MRAGLGVALVGLVACVGCGREPDAGVPQDQPVAGVVDSLPPVAKPELPQTSPEAQAAEPLKAEQKAEESEPTQPKSAQEEAVAAIKEMGGKVKVDKNKAVVSVFLNDTKVTDAGLVHLKGLTKLEQLYLRGTKVTPAGVKKLQQALANCRIDH